jgi:hypothetical protein
MDRRTFIHAAGATGLTGGFGPIDSDPSVTPLLRLLEDSPREHLPRQLVQRIRAGLRYQELLAALAWAAARNVQPYPDVGFKYHAVMVMRSINAASEHMPDAEHWLPIVWAADYFKDAQAQETAAGGWQQPTRSATHGEGVQAARSGLLLALDRWDRAAADAAIVNYSRLASIDELFAVLFLYGARDLRDIGHKAITVANAHSLVSQLGSGPESESILRSTVAALQNAGDGPNPAGHDLEPDRPWRHDQERLREIPSSWRRGRDDRAFRAQLRMTLYEVSPLDAGTEVVAMLRQGLSPDSIWQTLFDVAAEFVMAEPGIVTVHAQTTANALHYAYRVCSSEPTQQLMLLQCAAFIAMFRGFTAAKPTTFNLEELQPLRLHGEDIDAIDEIYADLAAGRRQQAARKALGYVQDDRSADALMARIRHHVAYQADEPHDYKFAEAVLDTCAHLGDAAWRRRFLSAGMAYFKAPGQSPHHVVQETLEFLRA